MINFSLSGKLDWVLSQAKTFIEREFKKLGDNPVAKSGEEKIQKLIANLKGDFPGDSDAGLVFQADAGEKHLTVNQLQFQASHPVEPVKTEKEEEKK
jgi:hypothetical protein